MVKLLLNLRFKNLNKLMSINRVILIVLDSVGIGALPDASEFGDEGSNTLGHIAELYPGFLIPNLIEMGLGNIEKRIEYLEGTLEVDSTPGKGTNILIDIPI